MNGKGKNNKKTRRERKNNEPNEEPVGPGCTKTHEIQESIGAAEPQ